MAANLSTQQYCKAWFSCEHAVHFICYCRWAFGVVIFELVSLGETPYPTIDPANMLKYLTDGNRMGRPANCNMQL